MLSKDNGPKRVTFVVNMMTYSLDKAAYQECTTSRQIQMLLLYCTCTQESSCQTKEVKIETELKRMACLRVITKQTESTDGVNSMVTVTKTNKIPISIDTQDLSKAITREHLPLHTIEVVAEMLNAKFVSVLEANWGFMQIQIDVESFHLCTLNKPLWKYLPFGISSTPEVFSQFSLF